MKKILVTGANGYLASLIMKTQANRFEFIPFTRQNADFARPEQVKEAMAQFDFDIVFHTAANANTAFCDAHPDVAYQINVASTKAIIELCQERKARLIFSSSEQCFSAAQGAPFDEQATPKANTIYGQNKIECEQLIQAADLDALILRYSWMMGASMPGIKVSPNIFSQVRTALMTQTPASFTIHEHRGLTYAQGFADHFHKLIDLPKGIYHITCDNPHTPYEAAKMIAKALKAKPEAIEQYILPNETKYANQPKDIRMLNTKLPFQLGSFEDNLARLLADFGWDV